MAEETDGIEEALEGQIRVAVTAAGLVGESIARAREQQQRQAQAVSEQQARGLETRLTAERQTARAELASVHQPEWWGRATPEQIGHAYGTAHTWAREDPEAARAEQRIAGELRSRYGIDSANTGAHPAAVRAAVARAEQDRAGGAGERTGAAVDQATAAVLLTQAEQQDRRAAEARQAAGHEPDPIERAEATAEAADRGVTFEGLRDAGQALYDSAERRDASARDLEAQGVSQEAVAAKMCADVSQAKPATEAVKGLGPKSAKAHKSRGHGPQVQRAGVER